MGDTDVEYKLLDINNTHDKICRKALDKKKDATKIINRVLSKEDRIQENEIQKYNSSFISNELKNSESDIVYKLNNENVFFLIEHQTKVDYLMPYRILKYELEIIESVLIDQKYINKEYKFPEIIAIVLYTGKQKWNAKLDLRTAQYKWRKYEGQELSKYNVLDINAIEEKELLKENSIISKIMLIEKSKTEKEFCENLNKIYKKINQQNKVYSEEDKKFLNTVIEVLAVNKFGKEKTKIILESLERGGEKTMLAVFDMFRESEARQRKEAKIEDVKNMLKENFPIKVISRITGITEEEIKKYK